MTKVALVILNYNGGKFILECLESTAKLKKASISLSTIVVDNASTDDSASWIKGKFPQVDIVQNKHNLGFAEGNNVGIRQALKERADFIWILNNDTIVDKSCLIELVNVANKKKAGIFAPKIYFAPLYETHRQRYKKSELGKVIWYAGGVIDWKNMLAGHKGVDEVDKGQYDQISKTEFVTGASMFIHRRALDVVGLFDSKYYLYYEDVDFCIRAKKKGFKFYFVPQAVLWHQNAQGSGGTGSDLQMYYITRNRLLIGMRYAPWRTKLALLREALNLSMHGTKTQKEAVGDFLSKKFGERGRPQFTLPKINLLKWFRR